MVFVVTPVEIDSVGEDEEAGEEEKENFHTIPTAIDEVTVEHVRVFRRGQPVLKNTISTLKNNG